MPHFGELQQLQKDVATLAVSATLPTLTFEVAPLTGTTIVIPDLPGRNMVFIVNPAGSLAALTIQFPTTLGSRDSQIVNFFFMQAITTITYTGQTALNMPTSITANRWLSTRRLKAGTWIKADF